MLSHLQTLLKAKITVLVYITHFTSFYPCFVSRALCLAKYSKIHGTRERLERKKKRKKSLQVISWNNSIENGSLFRLFFPLSMSMGCFFFWWKQLMYWVFQSFFSLCYSGVKLSPLQAHNIGKMFCSEIFSFYSCVIVKSLPIWRGETSL